MTYQDGDTLVRVVMSATSGLVEDQVVNDFAFRSSLAPTSANIDTLRNKVDAFYNTIYDGTIPLAKYLSESINRAATHRMDFYKISAGPLGSPIATRTWIGPDSPSTADSNLPTEVAGVLSFHGDLSAVGEESGATRPRARRRGRVYIGPLTTDAVTIGDESPKLGLGFRNRMAAAAVALMDASDTAFGAWSVWSRKDATLYVVEGGWTDNAVDIQRRRGAAATSRATWG